VLTKKQVSKNEIHAACAGVSSLTTGKIIYCALVTAF